METAIACPVPPKLLATSSWKLCAVITRKSRYVYAAVRVVLAAINATAMLTNILTQAQRKRRGQDRKKTHGITNTPKPIPLSAEKKKKLLNGTLKFCRVNNVASAMDEFTFKAVNKNTSRVALITKSDRSK